MHEAPGTRGYLRYVRHQPRPDRHDEHVQVTRARQGDPKAIEQLILANLAYVAHIAKEFRGGALPFDDLIAEGCVGLLEAIGRYRPESGTRFMTYASFWVRKEILAALSTQPHTVHVPRYARTHGVNVPRVRRLDVPKHAGDSMPLSERLPHYDPLPLQTIIEKGLVQRLRRLLLRLAPRDLAVLTWRYGLGGQPEQTLNEIAQRLGLSRERVRQIEASALSRIRDANVHGAPDARGGRRSAPRSMRL